MNRVVITLTVNLVLFVIVAACLYSRYDAGMLHTWTIQGR